MQVTIAGSGGWGTALAILLHENGHDVTLWSHFETESKQLAETHQNPYLPGVTLPEGLHYSADPACAQGREMVVFATPSFAVRTTAHAFAPYLAETPLLVSVTKGIEEGTGYRMSELVSQETGRTVVALSGPSHAEEVSRGIPTGVVVACPERELAERVQNAFMCSRFRVYTSPDTAGIELGAALKNVIALCAGVCDGMGYGDNTKALLMTRGLAEVARLGMALGAHRETFAGLAGVGDLIVTHVHALPQPPRRYPHRPGRSRAGGHEAGRRRRRGLLCRPVRLGAGAAQECRHADHRGGLCRAL